MSYTAILQCRAFELDSTVVDTSDNSEPVVQQR